MPARNSIGFLRFFFAALVIFSHSYPLGGFGADPFSRRGGPDTLGGIAVAGFFVLSGALIAQSWTRARSLGRFLWHRFLRIFPGFWVCLIVVTLVFGPLYMWIERGTVHGYWREPNNPPLEYLWLNALLYIRQAGIDMLLPHVPEPLKINGSLWTLEYEFLCYLLVAIFGVAGLLKQRLSIGRPIVLVCLIVSMVIAVRPEWNTHHPFDWYLFRFGRFFLAGVVYHQWRDEIPLRASLGFLALAITCVAAAFGRYHEVAPITFGYLVLWLGAILPLQDFDKRGDFSYGIYIYAYPVQQLLASIGWQKHGVEWFFLTSLALTIPLAVASYYLVERPCLRWKNVSLARLPFQSKR